jgi:hypothetical protein
MLQLGKGEMGMSEKIEEIVSRYGDTEVRLTKEGVTASVGVR